MMNFDETIAAISTAPGTGAIAIVRVSGDRAFAIAEKIFRTGRNFDPAKTPELKANHASHGFVFDPTGGDLVDEVVLTPFKAPQTYTGQDLVEISCHGGQVITAEILSVLLQQGARLARRGEFTQRAFMAGRMDLTQAEAVLDVIQAKTTKQGRRAQSALSGVLGKRIKQVRADVVELLTRIVAGIDFPEEIGDAPEPQVEEVTRRSLNELRELARTAITGRYLREGLKLAIVGRPNAGKSSLLNQLLKYERAIVTDIPGTTRDSLEEILDLNGIPVVLIDTAGIRATDDHVERIGIERSKKAIDECDLALLVVDQSAGWDEPEQQIVELIGAKPMLVVANKQDLVESLPSATAAAQKAVAHVAISAKTGKNLEALTAEIERFVFADETLREGPSLNARQAELCLRACQALELVLDTLALGYPQDCLATDLKTAVDALSEISGESVTEEVITEVFATFCIGK